MFDDEIAEQLVEASYHLQENIESGIVDYITGLNKDDLLEFGVKVLGNNHPSVNNFERILQSYYD